MEQVPLVSVIMSAYNCENYVTDAVSSILKQTCSDIEIIIVEDKSTDATLDKLRTIKDERIRLVCNSNNQRLTHNLNEAISLSKGKYIARMDCDDLSYSERIRTQVEYLERHNDIDVLGSFAETFGGSSTKLCYPIEHEEIKANLLFTNSLCHPAIMFRKDAIHSWYDEKYPAGQDYELWSRLIWKNQFHNIPKVLFRYRIHNGQTVQKNGQKQKEGAVAARKRMLEKTGCLLNEEDMKCFESIVDIGTFKSSEDMEKIQELLQRMLTANNKACLYDEKTLSNRCAKAFFDNWYNSLGHSNLRLSTIFRSPFASSFWRCSIRQKIGICLKLIQQKRKLD